VRDSEWLDWTKEMLPELKRRWPHNLAIQSLGSYDRQPSRDSYRTLCLLEDTDVAQVPATSTRVPPGKYVTDRSTCWRPKPSAN